MDAHKKTILLVKDNYTTMAVQSALLEIMGYDVIHASTGSDGINWADIEVNAFGILMIEIGRSVFKSLEILHKLRQSEKHHIIKAIAVTNEVDEVKEDELLAKGFDVVMEKSLTPDSIITHVPC